MEPEHINKLNSKTNKNSGTIKNLLVKNMKKIKVLAF